jgi:hypothetical protein
LLSGKIPEYIPSFYDPYMAPVPDELLTPNAVPDGPVITSLGVKYVGSADWNYGAMPEPGWIVLDDITKWREVVKLPDLTGRDWEGYYKKLVEKIDREKFIIMPNGGDYYLSLVSLMGFENALLAMHEEPEEVYALFEYLSEFYTTVLKQELYWLKPEVYTLMDDDAAYQAPFFSVDMYRKLIKPFHKKHCDLALDAGCYIDRHDCGKSEQFIDDWLELGVRSWNPAQVSNDLKAIKKKYGSRLVLSGCWDSQGELSSKNVDDKVLKDALVEYVDTFAPGGGFTFSAMIGGPMDDPQANEKREIVKDFYFDYVKDYYKTHA